MPLAVEDFQRIHPVFEKANPVDDSPDEICSDFTSISFQSKTEFKKVDRNHNELSETLTNLPEFNKMAHFATNYEKSPLLNQSLGDVIKKRSQISIHSIGPQSDEYSEFRNDARSTSTPILGQDPSEENAFEKQTKWRHSDEKCAANSTFTVPQNIKPPVQKILIPSKSNFSSSSNERTYSSQPESNVINILQQKVQREFRSLPIYSTAVKDDDGNYKIICKLESECFKYVCYGCDKSKEVAKRKSAENMLKKLGDDYSLKKLPVHDPIEFVTDAKLYFAKHLRNRRNGTLQSALDAVAKDDGRSGLGYNLFGV